jgi:hypothetical protein
MGIARANRLYAIGVTVQSAEIFFGTLRCQFDLPKQEIAHFRNKVSFLSEDANV